jgi:ferrous iron transport protein B
MFDVAKDKGYEIDVKKLSKELGVPVVPTVATAKEGLDKLKDEIVFAAKNKRLVTTPKINYGQKIEDVIDSLVRIIKKDAALSKNYPPRWLAIKLLENDDDALEKIKGSVAQSEILEVVS